MKILVAAAVLVASLSTTVLAQAPEGTPERVRGTIDSLEGDTLHVTTREGQPITVALTAETTVSGTVPRSLDEIGPGTYVASAGMPGPDGRINAVEVRIFPEELRGRGDGHRPFDLAPDSSMTNATVAEVVSVENGEVLKVTHKDGESELVIGPDTPIYSTELADRSLLQPGIYIVAFARKMPDGTIIANSVTAERDGLRPGM